MAVTSPIKPEKIFTMNKINQLEHRNKAKKKKPDFVLKDSKYKAGVPNRWRKPRGKHSPVRQQHKGRIKLVSVGYGSPRAVKHLHSSGLEKVLIQTEKDLKNIDPQKQGLIISGLIGNKKRIKLINLALEKKLTILNLKEPQIFLEKLESQFKKRQESKKKKLTEKEQKEIEKKKKAMEKEQKETIKDETAEAKPAEEKKKEQTKEAEKTIIKKQ